MREGRSALGRWGRCCVGALGAVLRGVGTLFCGRWGAYSFRGDADQMCVGLEGVFQHARCGCVLCHWSVLCFFCVLLFGRCGVFNVLVITHSPRQMSAWLKFLAALPNKQKGPHSATERRARCGAVTRSSDRDCFVRDLRILIPSTI